jgi:hypothetical protein
VSLSSQTCTESEICLSVARLSSNGVLQKTCRPGRKELTGKPVAAGMPSKSKASDVGGRIKGFS